MFPNWIDKEELAYPAGSIRQSRRNGMVLFPDGKTRKVRLGVPDTWFSIPARASVNGRTVAGYVTHSDELGYHFIAYQYRKNHAIVGRWPEKEV